MDNFPTEKHCRHMLVEIINRYFTNAKEKEAMLELAEWETPPVRHILTKLNQTGEVVSPDHGDVIKDIFFLWG